MKRAAFEVMLVSALVVLGLTARLAPHPANFTPIAAISLLAGFAVRNRVLAASAPILAMLAGDLVIGFYKPEIMAVVYASATLPIFFRSLLGKRISILRVLGCAAGCSLIFFVATNGATWAFSPLYEKTGEGLIACYAAGVPFIKMTLLGDLSWSLGLFGTYAAVAAVARRHAAAKVVPAVEPC